MGPDYSGACMWGAVLSVRVQWHRVDGNTWPLNGWHKVNCLWHRLMFTRLSLSPVGAIHLIQACGVVLEHSSPSNSLQDREALWGTTEWVFIGNIKLTESDQTTAHHPVLALALPLAGVTPVLRHDGMSSEGGWQGSPLWSTADSCYKCFSVVDSLALITNTVCVYSTC